MCLALLGVFFGVVAGIIALMFGAGEFGVIFSFIGTMFLTVLVVGSRKVDYRNEIGEN